MCVCERVCVCVCVYAYVANPLFDMSVYVRVCLCVCASARACEGDRHQPLVRQQDAGPCVDVCSHLVRPPVPNHAGKREVSASI